MQTIEVEGHHPRGHGFGEDFEGHSPWIVRYLCTAGKCLDLPWGTRALNPCQFVRHRPGLGRYECVVVGSHRKR